MAPSHREPALLSWLVGIGAWIQLLDFGLMVCPTTSSSPLGFSLGWCWPRCPWASNTSLLWRPTQRRPKGRRRGRMASGPPRACVVCSTGSIFRVVHPTVQLTWCFCLFQARKPAEL